MLTLVVGKELGNPSVKAQKGRACLILSDTDTLGAILIEMHQ